MENIYHNVKHGVFISMIGLNYVYPIIDSWTYSNICNAAIESGYEIVAILHDGVVYKYLIS